MASASATVSRVSTASGGDRVGLAGSIESNGFVLIDAPATRHLLGAEISQIEAAAFVDSWNGLPLDEYMADGGRYRRRRHAVYLAEASGLTRQPNQPHYQSLAHNSLNGGIARWFAPIPADIGDGPALRSVINLLISVSDRLRGTPGRWRVEAHQFRIEAHAGEAGQPTPEGMHRDGVDFVLVMLIGRRNIGAGRDDDCRCGRSAAGQHSTLAALRRHDPGRCACPSRRVADRAGGSGTAGDPGRARRHRGGGVGLRARDRNSGSRRRSPRQASRAA